MTLFSTPSFPKDLVSTNNQYQYSQHTFRGKRLQFSPCEMVPFQEICYRTLPILAVEVLLQLHTPLHQITMRLT